MIRHIASFSLALLLAAPALAEPDAAALYADHCSACHAATRLGGTGPALIPESLGRLKDEKLEAVIAKGRPATQMSGFDETLKSEEIKALAAFIQQPLASPPTWGEADIAATRTMVTDYKPANAPAFSADPMNITLVVETGDHHVSVLDGATFAVLDRFATPFAVHGGPKFSPDGRYVFIMSRDGWVQKYDIWSLAEVGRVRAGLNSRNIAMSHDGTVACSRQLSSTHTDDPFDSGPQRCEGHERHGQGWQRLSRISRLPGAAPQELRAGAEGRARNLGSGDRPRGWAIP